MPGLRVRVPFGNRQVTGILLSTAPESTVRNAKLKSVAEVLDTEPFSPSRFLRYSHGHQATTIIL